MSWRVDIIGHNWLIRRKWQHLNLLNDQIRHKFNQIDPFLKFIVQGSQKKYVRVAISQKFDEVFFQFPTRIIAKLVIENTTVVALLEDFVRKPYLFSEVCRIPVAQFKPFESDEVSSGLSRSNEGRRKGSLNL